MSVSRCCFPFPRFDFSRFCLVEKCREISLLSSIDAYFAMSIEKHEYETYYKFDVDLRFHIDFDFGFLQKWDEKKRRLLPLSVFRSVLLFFFG